MNIRKIDIHICSYVYSTLHYHLLLISLIHFNFSSVKMVTKEYLYYLVYDKIIK